MTEAPALTQAKTVAIVGSFRQHYTEVLAAWHACAKAGIEVTSPKGAGIVEEGVPFVRFLSDPSDWSDEKIQTVALHRILRADAIFVVAPNGYVGRTVCYEVGRIIHARRPLYFSHAPADLPIFIPQEHICSAETLIKRVLTNELRPLYLNSSDPATELEQALIKENYLSL